MKKTQSLLKRGKTAEEALDIHNEIKIITSADETFKLWSEVISEHSQGLLYDPETNPLKIFKENKAWRPEKDGVLNREFFKWLGNLTEADHRRFCEHVLKRSGDRYLYSYPKVTMKTISSVLIGCYSAKDWIERRKRKQLVRRELQNLKPNLQFFKQNGEFSKEKWRSFKQKYNVTSATMQVLLEAPGEDFFSAAKQTRNKNRKIEELSPYAKQFFKVFLKQKKDFRKPAGRAYFRPYSGMNTRLGPWPGNSWEELAHALVLGIIDFRRVPNWTQVSKGSASRPYFEDFTNALQRQSQPTINEPPIWLWICGTKEAEVQISTFAHKSIFTDVYDLHYSDYWPAPNERLEDRAANNKLARSAVHLIFLVRKSYRASRAQSIDIPSAFAAPQTAVYTKPRKYNELEYRIDTSELRMEFYLKVLEMFCKPGDSILSIFGGSKVLCAGLVSSFSYYHVVHQVLARIELINSSQEILACQQSKIRHKNLHFSSSRAKVPREF